jgi:death-on-curing family protein
VIYPRIEDYFNHIFNDIRSLAYDDLAKPIYERDRGLDKLEGVLEQIKNHDYYPTFYNKAAYLFASLSTGHYFQNGNKRLALFSFIYFARINNYKFRSTQKVHYRKWFKVNFPNYKIKNISFQSNAGWALYNFNKAMNIKLSENKEGHQYNFDELKLLTEDFIKFIIRK